ncbi:MAG: anti-sigma factor antagonist [Rhodoferax sp.]|nr:anti-sigma factor antagonist [Rhodoferax sp.]MBP7491124.1 anti-sigma factor antagonist [Rhodoferax sp.]
MSERFELPSELNIYSALETKDALLAWASAQTADAQEHLEVSARDVAEVDGAGLQMLAALSNMGLGWRLVETSEVFADACRTLGFSQWLDKRYLKVTAAGETA